MRGIMHLEIIHVQISVSLDWAIAAAVLEMHQW